MIKNIVDYGYYLEKISLIKDNVPLEYLEKINQSINIFSCKKGQQFIIEGSPVNGLFFICSGKVKVLKTGIFGKEQILRFVKEGEIVGHRGFGTKEKYGISALAIEDCILCNFSNEVMSKMLIDIPELTYALMLFYAEELNRSETKVKALAQMTVREKVIDTLLYIHRKFGVNHKSYIDLVLSRKEIADFAGTTDEQVIRTISALKKEGHINTLNKHIELININNLKNEIAEHNFFLDS